MCNRALLDRRCTDTLAQPTYLTVNLRKWLGIELIEVSSLEIVVSTIGGGLSLAALFAFTSWALPHSNVAAVVASMGASAVLLFAVPHGPLSQPWPVISGHGISAVIGVLCAQLIAEPTVAVACAVGISIGAMYRLKCIHPPGGATAFTAVMGGEAIRQLGIQFVIFPVLMNAIVMVVLAILINGAFRWRRYPAILSGSTKLQASILVPETLPPTHEEVLGALRSLDSFVDISEEDLLRLVKVLADHRVSHVGNDARSKIAP